MKVGSLFSGIGGFDLGLERAGMQVVWQSEIEPYCCQVLKKHWPEVPNLGDIFKIKDPPPVDLVCGGFPCQPFSVAGKRQGKADDRYLWPEMLRVITEVKPRWVFAENVPGIIHMELDQVLSDLEGQGYETGTLIIPACAVGAPQVRYRIWILAYNKKCRCVCLPNEMENTKEGFFEGRRIWESSIESLVADLGLCPDSPDWRVVDGFPDWVDRLKALGNAIVPQIAEEIGRMIMKVEESL